MGVLIDTGSDRDFLHPNVAEALHLHLDPIRPFKVYVGNGEALLYTHVSRQTKLEVQGTVFSVDFHILAIHGPDIILGMDWLESLGKVTVDFSGKTLEFTHGDKAIVLKGIMPPPREISLHSLATFLSPADNVVCFEVTLLSPDTTAASAGETVVFPVDLPPCVMAILKKFRPVFGLPCGLPPQRSFDHRVHLLPGTKPINVRPYRYPYFQKNEIEHR